MRDGQTTGHQPHPVT